MVGSQAESSRLLDDVNTYDINPCESARPSGRGFAHSFSDSLKLSYPSLTCIELLRPLIRSVLCVISALLDARLRICLLYRTFICSFVCLWLVYFSSVWFLVSRRRGLGKTHRTTSGQPQRRDAMRRLRLPLIYIWQFLATSVGRVPVFLRKFHSHEGILDFT